MRRDVFPGGVGLVEFIHGGGLLFAGMSARIGSDGLGCDVLRRSMQPAGQHRALHQLLRAPRQRRKHSLRHILGKMRVANHPQSC